MNSEFGSDSECSLNGESQKTAGFDDAVLGELLHDEADPVDLLSVVTLLVEKLRQRLPGGGAIEADQRTDEETKATGLRLGTINVGLGPDLAQHPLQPIDVIGGDRPVHMDLAYGEFATVLAHVGPGLDLEPLEASGRESGERNFAPFPDRVLEVGVDDLALALLGSDGRAPAGGVAPAPAWAA